MELTSQQVVATAAQSLLRAGFSEVGELATDQGNRVRLFEDAATVVGVSNFETWDDLEASWKDIQAAIVEIMSGEFLRSDPKAWEGYLVLLTVSPTPSITRLEAIRRDTARLRKLVATGSDLRSLSSIREVLLPVLPLDLSDVPAQREGILERLPELLAARHVPETFTQAVISAFNQNESLVEALWKVGRE